MAILLIFFLAKQNIISLNLTNPQIKPVNSFIQSCIDQTAENAIQHIGENGGYFTSPNNSLDNAIPIYFNKGQTQVPTKEQIESELSEYINTMLFFCTKNFADFQDFKITQKEIKTTTQIQKGEIIFNINYPLSLTKEEKTYQLENFNTEIPSRLLTVQEAASKIIQDQKEFPEELCITCIEETTIEKQLIVNMRDYQDSIIFSITDYNQQINQKEFIFYFANKY